jgi:DNA-cytosine methyltransferase
MSDNKPKRLTVGSLFAGIGGFDLGFERAGFETVWQVEIDDYCRRVLERHFPRAERFGDIRGCGAHNLKPVDIICGGFPCQDISYAGPGGGLAGERSGLWYEFARVIRQMGPRVVVVENVTALLERGLESILGTLANLGFDAEWSSISACSMGATHMRRRLFIVAHANVFDGRPRVWNTNAQPFRPLQTIGDFTSARAGTKSRLANPSELYGGADGLAWGMERNHAIGNSVYPKISQWIAERIKESLSQC